MWRVQVFNRQKEPLFTGWFHTPAEAGEFVEDTIDQFLAEHADFYVLTDGSTRVEYNADEAASCIRRSYGQPAPL